METIPFKWQVVKDYLDDCLVYCCPKMKIDSPRNQNARNPAHTKMQNVKDLKNEYPCKCFGGLGLTYDFGVKVCSQILMP